MGSKIKVIDSGSNKNLASPDSQLTFKNKSTILPKFDEYFPKETNNLPFPKFKGGKFIRYLGTFRHTSFLFTCFLCL